MANLTYYDVETLASLDLPELYVMAQSDNLPNMRSYVHKNELVQALITHRIHEIQAYNADINRNAMINMWFDEGESSSEEEEWIEWTDSSDEWSVVEDSGVDIGIDIPTTNSTCLDIHIDSNEQVISGLNLAGMLGSTWYPSYTYKDRKGGWLIYEQWPAAAELAHRLQNGQDPYPKPNTS